MKFDTATLYMEDAYLQSCNAEVLYVVPRGVVLDRTVFYLQGGGQPGDSGTLTRDGGEPVTVVDTCRSPDGGILHVIDEGHTLQTGDEVVATIDWERRYAHMRMHTALHVLSALIRHGVYGGRITTTRSWLDFDMPDYPNLKELTAQLNEEVEADRPVTCRWITRDELDARPELVRTMNVEPPPLLFNIRLLEIEGLDLQPCGGTHVKSTAEIGRLAVLKIVNKGKHNRRIHLVFEEDYPALAADDEKRSLEKKMRRAERTDQLTAELLAELSNLERSESSAPEPTEAAGDDETEDAPEATTDPDTEYNPDRVPE